MRKHILVIDDDIDTRSLLELYLGRFYRITSKSNGMEAKLWLDEGNLPDLIITDINMPEIGGYEFLKLIRNSGFFQEVPVVILTGLDDEEVKNKCNQQGVDEFIVKPFNPSDLLSKISALLKIPKFQAWPWLSAR